MWWWKGRGWLSFPASPLPSPSSLADLANDAVVAANPHRSPRERLLLLLRALLVSLATLAHAGHNDHSRLSEINNFKMGILPQAWKQSFHYPRRSSSSSHTTTDDDQLR